jgi:hypothetical protein
MPPYKLFRSRNWPDLACAVPEDRALPPFMTDASWEFVGTLTSATHPQIKFDETAADVGVRYCGFYLFQVVGPPQRKAVPSSPRTICLHQPSSRFARLPKPRVARFGSR